MNTDRIEKQILLHAPLARVWRALSDSTEFGTWFGMKFDRPFTPGARLNVVITPTKVDPEIARAQKQYEGLAYQITIERMDPERLFSFRWHPSAIDPGVDYSLEPTTLVEFKLEQTPDGVLLTVTESGFDQIPLERRAKAFSNNEQGWGAVIRLIAAFLAHAE
ncbi:MAG TPA: SRPBCC family protein [Candidatus Acidoferrales bacterium]|nr:SRPBCC family protein [Candidatus Acidoferrales bacterium]